VQYSFFPQGTVQGEKYSIPGDQLSCTSTASSLLWNFVYKLTLRSTIHLSLRLPPPLLFAIVADVKVTEIRSGIEVKKGRCGKGNNSFGVTHNWPVRVRGSGKEEECTEALGREDSI
jgi:hypothetical protein